MSKGPSSLNCGFTMKDRSDRLHAIKDPCCSLEDVDGPSTHIEL